MRAISPWRRINVRRTLALVLAGGPGTRLFGLTRTRAKPAVPFGGNHRIIDYALSNCVNSAIPHVAVLTQYKAQSLIRHLQQNWLDGSQQHGTDIEIWPAQQRNGSNWYAGTADAVHQNQDLIEELDPENILILAGDHIYAMDYASLIAARVMSHAPVTVSCVEVPAKRSHQFGVADIDDASRLTNFVDEPDSQTDWLEPDSEALASMGVYLFRTDYLFECLEADAGKTDSGHDFGRDVLPGLLGKSDVHVHRFRDSGGEPGYWRDVGTVDSYWAAHQELLERQRLPRSRRSAWPLGGGPRMSVPARLSATASVSDSLLGAECFVGGAIAGSVVSNGCRVDAGAVVNQSVLLPGVTIGRNCFLNRVIVDSRCQVPDGTVLDASREETTNGCYVSPSGVVLVTKLSDRPRPEHFDRRASA